MGRGMSLLCRIFLLKSIHLPDFPVPTCRCSSLKFKGFLVPMNTTLAHRLFTFPLVLLTLTLAGLQFPTLIKSAVHQ